MTNIKACLSHNSDEWETPSNLYKELNEKYGKFTIDLCASETNALCKRYFTRETFDEDKIYRLRGEKIYCNPPYSKLSYFISICSQLSLNNLVVMLIPARTDTKAFHQYIYNKSGVQIEFIKGRLKFAISGVQKKLSSIPIYDSYI